MGLLTSARPWPIKITLSINLKPLASAHLPILCVCGDADTIVPMKENILIVQDRYLRLGGPIRLIVKPGNGHHPHSLKDPTPIVDFIMAAVGNKNT
jgi:alpha-beta hydrolase superfamily lysophospholipase